MRSRNYTWPTREERAGGSVMETWLGIAGFSGAYQVSDAGNVRSVNRLDAAGQRAKGRVLRLRRTSNGYRRVSLCKQGVNRDYYVHRLVLEAFVGPCPDGMEACHGNGIKNDNRLSNLRWDTPRANSADKKTNGTQPLGAEHYARRAPHLVNRGTNHMWAKLVPGDVERIRDLLACGCTHKSIARWIGTIGRENVGRIARGLSWRIAV